MSDADPSPDRHRARLEARLRRRFQLYPETFRLGPLVVPFVRVEDPQVVLDDVIRAESAGEPGQRLPYWAELWDSALGVGTFLASGGLAKINPRWVALDRARPIRAMDLGCGMGLTGRVALELGCDVLLGDIETSSLLFARLNTIRFASRARCRRIDWQRDRLTERFDLIIGADVLYERSQWDYLEPFFRAHLDGGGHALLGEPSRPSGDHFANWIASRGWSVRLFEQRVPTHTRAIRMFCITPNP